MLARIHDVFNDTMCISDYNLILIIFNKAIRERREKKTEIGRQRRKVNATWDREMRDTTYISYQLNTSLYQY